MSGRARAQEAQGTVPVRPFAGMGLDYSWFIERTTPVEPAALDRWKALQDDGWDVVALVDDQATTMVGLGCRYRPVLEATG